MRSYRVVIFALLTPAMILAGALALAFATGAQAQTSASDVVKPNIAPAADDATTQAPADATTQPAPAAATTQPAPEPARPATPEPLHRPSDDIVTTVPAVIKTNIPKSNVPRPTTKIPEGGCVTEKCHPGVKDFKVLHGPVNVNACDACHTLTSAKNHTFKLARGRTTMCTFCHKIELDGPVVHKPVKTGDCLPCHDPHGASNKQFLRGKTMNDLCSACHKNVIAGKSHVHGPAAAGACGACHQAHVSKYPKLLVAQGRDLCLGCHAEMKRQIDQAKIKHKAVEGDCLNCHDAHASNYTMQTLEPPVQLCTSKCHQKVKASALDSKYKHDPILAGQACLNCHMDGRGGRM